MDNYIINYQDYFFRALLLHTIFIDFNTVNELVALGYGSTEL